MKCLHPGAGFQTRVDRFFVPLQRRFALHCAAIWAIVFFWNLTATAQVSREYQLKAVFLFNFAQFTVWPASAFANDKTPIVIGIVGADPFGSALNDTVHGETIDGRPLLIEHYPRSADIKPCHILFISQQESRYTDDILKLVKGKPVLTVADVEIPPTSGVMIRFIVENNKVHFRINAEAARLANITLSSKLLRVAEVAPTGKTMP
jgi:hypothetical protein